jgi:hypothetical protein
MAGKWNVDYLEKLLLLSLTRHQVFDRGHVCLVLAHDTNDSYREDLLATPALAGTLRWRMAH